MYRCAGINLCFNTHRSRCLGSVPFFFFFPLLLIQFSHAICTACTLGVCLIAANTPPLHTGCEVICSQRNYIAKARNKKLRLHPKYPELLSPRNNFFKEPRGSLQPVVCVISAPPSTTKTIVDPLTVCFLLYLHVDMSKTQRTEKKPVYSFSKWWLT